MKFLSKEKISQHKYKTPEGYLVCVDSILARTGKQTYTRDEVFHDGSDEEIEVDRTCDEVFAPSTLASFENKPLTVEHPDEDVNSGNWKDYQVGFVRDIKRGKGENGEDVMLGTLVIQDAQTIKEIEAGEHTQLSCGYDCDITDDDNPRQIRIKGNHVALCQQGRAGVARIVDSTKDTSNPRVVEFIGNQHLVGKLRTLAKQYPKNQIRPILCEEKEFNSKMTNKEIEEAARELKIELHDSIHDSVFEIGFVTYADQTDYVDVEAKDEQEALDKVRKMYQPYRIFHCRKVKDTVKDVKVYFYYLESAGGQHVDPHGKLTSNPNSNSYLEFKSEQEAERHKKFFEQGLGVQLYVKKDFFLDSVEDDFDYEKAIKILKQHLSGHPAPTTDIVKNVLWKYCNFNETQLKEFAKRTSISTLRQMGVFDSCTKDVDPREGESKEDFIARFMKETESEYPDEKQRLAVAYSYWDKKGKDSMKDSEVAYNGFKYMIETTYRSRPDQIRAVVEKIKGADDLSADEKSDLIARANRITGDSMKDDANIEKYQEWVDYDMKRFGKISGETMEKIKEAGFSVVKDQYGNYEVIAKDPDRDSMHDDLVEMFQARVDYALKNFGRVGGGLYDELDEAGLYLDRDNKVQKKVKDSCMKKDAKNVYTITWIDLANKAKGYPREEWRFQEDIKADTLREAFQQLANRVALGGTGTYNANIVSVSSPNKSYFYYGRLSELLNRVTDSKKK